MTPSTKLLVVALVAISSAMPASGQATAERVTIGCDGLFGRNTDEQRLRASFGDDNVKTVRIGYESLDRYRSETSVFWTPTEYLGEVHVVWHEEDARRRPSSVSVYGGKWDIRAGRQEAGSRDWQGPSGIRTGMTLTDLEALNGRPFTFKGDDWSYVDVTSWNGGRLAEKAGECAVRPTIVFFDAPRYHSKHVGPCPLCRERMSDDPDARAWDGRVYRFSVGYPP